MIVLLPLALVAYAWAAEKKVHISAICVVLFVIGFSSVYVICYILCLLIVSHNTHR